MLTGSYNNAFHVYDVQGKNDITLEASKNGAGCRASQGVSGRVRAC